MSGKVDQRGRQLREAPNEPPVEVGESQEALDVSDARRDRPGKDGGDLGGVHLDASRGDHESQEFDRGMVEYALLEFGIQPVQSKSFQHQADMPIVFLLGAGEYQDVVQVDDDENV